MQSYPSHVTQELFDLIRADLEAFHKSTIPRKVDLYDVFNAFLYVLYTKAQWRFPQMENGPWLLLALITNVTRW